MGKKRRSAGGGNTNSDRKCGKAFKKFPKKPNYGATGRTIGGYSPAKLEQRAAKRAANQS
jgi:hypothetical protein